MQFVDCHDSFGISHLGFCPQLVWNSFAIFFSFHTFASPFSYPPSIFLWRRGASLPLAPFPPGWLVLNGLVKIGGSHNLVS